MRLQVGLSHQIVNFITSSEMANKGDRHNEWNKLAAVILNRTDKLRVFLGGKCLVERPCYVVKDIDVPTNGNRFP